MISHTLQHVLFITYIILIVDQSSANRSDKCEFTFYFRCNEETLERKTDKTWFASVFIVRKKICVVLVVSVLVSCQKYVCAVFLKTIYMQLTMEIIYLVTADTVYLCLIANLPLQPDWINQRLYLTMNFVFDIDCKEMVSEGPSICFYYFM